MFKVSLTDGSFTEFTKLFGIYPYDERDIAFYRPIFREALHNIYYSTFGLNHFPFRVLLFALHFINISLVYLCIQNIIKRRFLSFFTAFFFAISSAHISTLYYIPGGIEASGATLFALLTIILFKKYLDNAKLKFKIISLITFLLALSSHEIILSTPLVLMGLIVISYPRKQRLRKVFELWPFFLGLLIILYIDIFKIGFSPNEKQYEFVFNIKTIFQSLIWYSAWAYGLPETLIDFVRPAFSLNPNLMRYWGDFYRIIFPAFFISFAFLLFFTLYLLLRNRSIILNKSVFFLLYWFLVGITPVISLPAHKSSHYLVFVLPAFWAIVGYICINFYSNLSKSYPLISKLLILIFISSQTLLISTSIKLGHTSYWAAERGRLAKKLIKEITTTYPSLPKGALIYFTNDPTYPYLTQEWGGTSKQASLILNGSDALQLLYKDPTLKAFYQDLGGIPKDLAGKHIYSIVARIGQ